MTTRFLSRTLIALILLGSFFLIWPASPVRFNFLAGPVRAAPPVAGKGQAKIAPEVQAALNSLQAGEMLSVIVTFKDQANLNQLAVALPRFDRAARLKHVIEQLQAKANAGQRAVKTWLTRRQARREVGEITFFWIFNGLAVTATPAVIQELAVQPEVLSITPNEIIQGPPLPPAEQGELGILATEPNLSLINVPALWDIGYKGQGIVVANLDTGVDGSHPNLAPKWRGGTNSWFDAFPSDGNPNTPVDIAGSSSGHGTQTMGIMVGGQDNFSNTFGIAPEAKWIAAKVFKNNGSGTTAGFHAAFQWLLDPDGNPATPDAPDVVNNSWTFGNPNSCNLAFQADLQALRAAGILPIFAAGNAGPNASTSYSPANYPEALSVGNISNSNIIYPGIGGFGGSSRGPRPATASGCNPGTVFPDVVAPGVNIRTTDRFSSYTNATPGTSFAAPHVAGALALLLDAFPNLTVDEQEACLVNLAVNLGAAGPDDTYGHGRIDTLAVYQAILSGGCYRIHLPLLMRDN